MATFSAWWQTFVKKHEVRPVTFICGTERVLAEDVLANIRARVRPDPWNWVPLVAGEDSEREIWSQVFQVPARGESRLVVVRAAERLKDPGRILTFAKRADAHPHTYLVLMSSSPSVPRAEPTEDQKRAGRRGDVVPWLALGARAHVIECRPFTAATASVAVAWVQAKVSMRTSVAGHLLNRADGNMRLVRDTCAKLAMAGQEPSIAAVNDLLSAQPRDTLVDALIALDKKGALAALERIQPDDYARVLGALDSTVDLAGMVHDMTLERATPHEIARKAGSKQFLIKDLLSVAGHYDARRRAAIRSVLALADEALRSGAKVGVMESVIALW